MNSCSVRNRSATSWVAVSVIAGSLWMMKKSGESRETWLNLGAGAADRHRAWILDEELVYRLSPRLTYSCMKLLVSGLSERPLRISALRFGFDTYSGASPIVFCASST